MICPILSIQLVKNSDEQEFIECLKSDCAWYIQHQKQCAIASIVTELAYVGEKQ